MSEGTLARMRRFVDEYDEGIITAVERFNLIIDCALADDFFDHLNVLPDEMIRELRDSVREGEEFAHPEDVLILSTYLGPLEWTESDRDEFYRALRERCYWSKRLLREHFFPERSPPKFEVVKCIGIIEESSQLDGNVIVHGVDIEGWMIRKNPIHCITPASQRIITSGRCLGLIKRPGDEDSKDYIIQRFGKSWIELGPEVRSTDQVPVGTEIWVDREGVKNIPPRPAT